MNSILAFVIVCGAGAACSQRVRRNGVFGDSLSAEGETYPAEAHAVTPAHPVEQIQTIGNIYQRNERLVALIEKLFNALPISANYKPSPNLRSFTFGALFMLHYFDAETGSFDSDLRHAFDLTFPLILKNKPVHVLAAPVWTMGVKFVSAVANRIGYVQEYCYNNRDCVHDVLKRDAAELRRCPSYHHHVFLHNIALKRIIIGEELSRILMNFTSQNEVRASKKSPITAEAVKEVLKPFENYMLLFKDAFRVLKNHDYHCFHVDPADDHVDSVNNHVEQSCQASCRN